MSRIAGIVVLASSCAGLWVLVESQVGVAHRREAEVEGRLERHDGLDRSGEDLRPSVAAPVRTGVRERLAEAVIRIVSLPDGEALPGALFHVRHEPRVTTADELGCIRYPSLSATWIEFETTAPGHCVTRGFLTTGISGDEPTVVPLLPSSAVEGRVLDDLGSVVPHAYLTLSSPDEDSSAPERSPKGIPDEWTVVEAGWAERTPAGKDGGFSIDGLLPDTEYVLRAWKPRYAKAVVELRTRGPGEPRFLEIVLDREEKPETERRGAIEGRVFLNGEAICATVILDGEDRGSSEMDGSYRLARLPEGEHGIYALPARWHAMESWPWRRDVRVVAFETVEHDIHLEIPLQPIRGRAVYQDGRAAAEIGVEASCAIVSVACNASVDGSFELQVPDLGEPYRIRGGGGIGSVFLEDVTPGSENHDLILPIVADFYVDARDGDRRLRRVKVWVRRFPSAEWEHEQESHWPTDEGHPFRTFPGTVDLWIESDRYQPVELSNVEIFVDRSAAPTFEVSLVRK